MASIQHHPRFRRWLAASSDRRQFLSQLLAGSVASLVHHHAHASPRRPSAIDRDPFQLGVASGEPSPDGVVLWTRLAPNPLEGGGLDPIPLEVRYEVFADESLKELVRQGTAIASPELAHSVHVELEGLSPDRWYWYRFHFADATSPVGRTRTTPAKESTPESLRFAFASCQHYETGYYHAYHDMVQQSLDAIVHLGDYIYEGAGVSGRLRQHQGGELKSLSDYRNRHAQYKTDGNLQAAHAHCPWLVTWDDHEFDNNYAGNVSEESSVDVEQFLKRRAAAYQAYYEHMPLRRRMIPRGPDMDLYRAIPFGRLACFQVLDTRQYRTDQPCGDGSKPPCPETFSPDATLLGDRQEEWLFQSLQDHPATWNILAQQVMMARVDRIPGEKVGWSMDQWSGYDTARKRLLQQLKDRQIENPTVLTGDIHNNWVNDLHVDFDRPESPPIATEWVGTSISSGGDGKEDAKDRESVMAENPFVKFYNAERGYVLCEVTSKQWRSDYRVVPKVTAPEPQCHSRAQFLVSSGRPGAQRIE